MKGIQDKHSALLLVAVWVLMLLPAGGCLYIPYYYRGSTGRVPDTTAEEFIRGRTTRSDMILRIGPPDVRQDNDLLFIYRWRGSYGMWVGLGGGGGTVYSLEALCVFFNSDNTLKRYDYISNLASLREVENPECDSMLIVCDEDLKKKLIERCTQHERTGGEP
jgi:hypothetical protein